MAFLVSQPCIIAISFVSAEKKSKQKKRKSRKHTKLDKAADSCSLGNNDNTCVSTSKYTEKLFIVISLLIVDVAVDSTNFGFQFVSVDTTDSPFIHMPRAKCYYKRLDGKRKTVFFLNTHNAHKRLLTLPLRSSSYLMCTLPTLICTLSIIFVTSELLNPSDTKLLKNPSLVPAKPN